MQIFSKWPIVSGESAPFLDWEISRMWIRSFMLASYRFLRPCQENISRRVNYLMLFLPRKSLFEDIPILKASSWKDSELSTASLEGLRELLPSDEIDLSRNVDLLATSFNGCNVNLVNKNGDAIDSETAVQIIDLFKHKPINLEHKGPKIVGHIVKSAFSTFEDDTKIISADDVKNSNEVFNVALGSVVYRHLHREFAELLIRAADPKDKLYQKISTSWEISFRDFHLVLGSRLLKEAEIISDPKQISEMKKHLKKYGGTGFLPDGKTPVYRKVLGPDVLPTAFAYTSNPAAAVRGVLVKDGKQKTTAAISLFVPKEKKCVIKDKTPNHNMDIEETIQEMAASVKQLVAENKNEEAVASVRKTIESAIKEANKEFITERDKARTDREASEAKLTELYAQVEKMSEKMMKAERKMYEMEEQSRAAKTMIRYNERMAAMQDEYEMDEEDCAVVASELKTLEVKDEDDKDEVFAAFKEKMGKLWRHKNKVAKAAYQKELDDKVQAEVQKKLAELSTASTVKTGEEGKAVDEALEKAKATEEKSVSNNNENTSAEKSLADRFGSALKVKISH